MGEHTSKLAGRIKRAGIQEDGTGVIRCAEYVSPSAIRIGGQLFSHNVRRNPDCTAAAGDTVLVTQIGSSFYVVCKVV